MEQLIALIGTALVVLEWVGYGLALVYGLWIFYLAVMNLKRARDVGRLYGPAVAPGVFSLVLGYFLDFVVNVFVFSVILLEPPRETTVTARLKRHAAKNTWRGAVARWFAANFLDPFDPSGRHV